jgi:hypothetical protein
MRYLEASASLSESSADMMNALIYMRNPPTLYAPGLINKQHRIFIQCLFGLQGDLTIDWLDLMRWLTNSLSTSPSSFIRLVPFGFA